MKKIFDNQQFKQRPEVSSPLRHKIHEIVFEAETPQGKMYDVILLIMILLSILVLMLETVPALWAAYSTEFYLIEWIFTIFFTIEYGLRIYSVRRPKYYIFSFYGMVDLLSILPSYLALFVPGIHALMIIRSLRLIRVFRIFKLDAFVIQGNAIAAALAESRKKLTVFALMIIILSIIFGSVMYLAEHNANPKFDSIPRGIYWTIVTITTVGYGDISPVTSFGQLVASCIMLMGYIIIAVPTGIVTSSVIQGRWKYHNTISCPECATEGHETDALFCRKCGAKL
jgi:voltage-gated potassium channel